MFMGKTFAEKTLERKGRDYDSLMREIGRLRAALEEIVRESNGVNKGAVAQKIAIDALANNGPTESGR